MPAIVAVVDRLLKKIDLGRANKVADVIAAYQRATGLLDIASIAQKARDRIQNALKNEDLPLLLANYDNKGLLAVAARHLKATKLNDFESWLTRVLRNDQAPGLVAAMKQNLPTIQAA